MSIEGMSVELEAAVKNMADAFDAMLIGPESTFQSLTCGEVEAVALVLARAGRHETARGILDAHAEGDDIGDAHYLGTKEEE
jgi:hypothetical protein